MADYKELLRRAVEALPENNGAARRAVYEKARAALVGQLRAINPPLAARDITAHRLQLEDCIRQVEQEASEAVIAGLGSGKEESPPPPPVYFEAPVKKPAPSIAKTVVKPAPTSGREPPKPLPQGGSIEEIIAAANAEPPAAPIETKRSAARADGGKPMGKPVPKLVANTRPQIPAPMPEPEPEPEDELPPPPPRAVPARPAPSGRQPFPSGRPLPSIVARAEAAKSRTSTAAFGAPIGGPTRGPVLEPRREIAAPRHEPIARPQLTSRPAAQLAVFDDPPMAAAMSAVREVDLDPQPVDPQGAIDRAIATLDREARGEPVDNELDYDPVENDEDEDDTPSANGFPAGILRADAPAVAPSRRGRGGGREPKAPKEPKAARERNLGRATKPAQTGFPRAERERRGMGAVTIFLIVFAVLLAGAGGAGFWAWREGFINLDQMFGRSAVTEQEAAAATTPANGDADAPATGPGNTDTPSESNTPSAELNQDERLGAEPAAVADTPALPLLEPAPAEERLGTDSEPAAEAAVAALDPANLAGSQSLLLEASDNGTTGAVPFSGTVEWSKGIDEMGVATLIGKANIPARNLGVDVLIRKNSDPSLPASHLMEVNFRVSDSFVGGSIAGLPGVLLKNEELVQGTPLVGASARVVGNSFLFALSASPDEITANSNLLTSRKWMDLALIYATGRRAIITLEKDEAAVAMFNEVVGSWGTAATASQ